MAPRWGITKQIDNLFWNIKVMASRRVINTLTCRIRLRAVAGEWLPYLEIMRKINLPTGSTSFSIPSVPLNKLLVWFSNRMGTSVDNGARKSNNWLDQWQSGKLGTGSHVYSFPRAFPSSTDVPVLLLNHPNYPCQCLSTSIRWKVCDLSNLAYLLLVIIAGFGCPVVPDV